ncbi:hypothetical protein BS78_10G155600 [Paspalum vaginatum]|nr:hypothetical protein BS78_10G155600 [Paspalum vaginatum]
MFLEPLDGRTYLFPSKKGKWQDVASYGLHCQDDYFGIFHFWTFALPFTTSVLLGTLLTELTLREVPSFDLLHILVSLLSLWESPNDTAEKCCRILSRTSASKVLTTPGKGSFLFVSEKDSPLEKSKVLIRTHS